MIEGTSAYHADRNLVALTIERVDRVEEIRTHLASPKPPVSHQKDSPYALSSTQA